MLVHTDAFLGIQFPWWYSILELGQGTLRVQWACEKFSKNLTYCSCEACSSHVRQHANLQSQWPLHLVAWPPLIPWKPSAQKEGCIVLHLCVLSVEAQSVNPSQGCLLCGTHNRNPGWKVGTRLWSHLSEMKNHAPSDTVQITSLYDTLDFTTHQQSTKISPKTTELQYKIGNRSQRGVYKRVLCPAVHTPGGVTDDTRLQNTRKPCVWLSIQE